MSTFLRHMLDRAGGQAPVLARRQRSLFEPGAEAVRLPAGDPMNMAMPAVVPAQDRLPNLTDVALHERRPAEPTGSRTALWETPKPLAYSESGVGQTKASLQMSFQPMAASVAPKAEAGRAGVDASDDRPLSQSEARPAKRSLSSHAVESGQSAPESAQDRPRLNARRVTLQPKDAIGDTTPLLVSQPVPLKAGRTKEEARDKEPAPREVHATTRLPQHPPSWPGSLKAAPIPPIPVARLPRQAQAAAQALPPPAQPPAVQISIGRIEVRASTAPVERPRAAKPAGPAVTLDDYLRQRRGGER